VFHHLVRVVRAMREGQAMVMLPENECLTTQAAANYLGVSRPFLVKLLEEEKIPHHRTGTHRRIYLKDLLEYQKRRDTERKKTLDDLASEVSEAGFYDRIPPLEDAG
jgi:excisionase family DNA binding protein